MNNPRYTAVIFDMGDIFFDATKWRRAMTVCLQHEHVAIDYQTFCSQWEAKLVEVYLGRRIYWDAFRELIADFRLSEEAAARVLDFAKAKAAEVEQRTLFDGVAETLARLKAAGLKLAVLSDTESREPRVRQRLATLGIEQHFDAVLTSIDIGYVKPSLDAYMIALQRLKVGPTEAIFVGHDQDELDGARQCGLTAVAYNHEDGILADHCIGHFPELLCLANQSEFNMHGKLETDGNAVGVAGADLAVFTGKPAFAQPLHVGRPNLGDNGRLMERLQDVLDRRWVTNAGRYVREFEAAIAEAVGVRHCIAMCNATVALEILIRAAGLSGEVIVPSFTFIATAHALQWQEITPVFADIDPHTHNLDPARVEEMITPRTTGIIGVHLWGRACDVDELQNIAERHRLKLLFDAAHAFGCSHQGRMIGSLGQAEVFSFHGTKFVNSGEGGAVVTNDDEIAAKIRLMKNFGFAGSDRVVYLGTNGKMSEFCAALGLTNLESMQEIISANRKHYEHYRSELCGLPGITMVDYSGSEKANYQYIVLEVDANTAGISRDSLLRVLHAENVLARRYFYPGCHRMEPYKSYYPHAGLLLPHTESLCERVLLLPNGTTLTEHDVTLVCQVIQTAVNEGTPLERRLSEQSVHKHR